MDGEGGPGVAGSSPTAPGLEGPVPGAETSPKPAVGAAAARSALAAASGRPVVCELAGSSLLVVAGPDAADFLHGQLANDVKGLGGRGTVRSLLLNHKGHAMAEAQVVRSSADEFLVVVDDGMGDWVLETLERHVVFDDVRLSREPAVLFTVQGSGASREVAAGLSLPDAEVGSGVVASEDGTVVTYPSRRSEAGGVDVLVRGGVASIVRDTLAERCVLVGEDGIDAARVAAGISAAGREGGEGVLPQEAGLEGYVSFRKGCYLGQEIMARIEARGAVKRGLTTLELEGPTDARDVMAGDRVVGRLGTVAEMPDDAFRALAVVRRDLSAGTALSVGGVRATKVE